MVNMTELLYLLSLPPPVTFCDWRVSIDVTAGYPNCKEYHSDFVAFMISGAVLYFLSAALFAAHLVYRKLVMKFTVMTEKGEIQPVEGLFLFLMVFCISRGIDCALVASNHFDVPTDVQAGELTFEWAWPFGFAAIVFYIGGLVRMLVKIKYDNWFYKVLRRPHVINGFCFVYAGSVFVVQMALAGWAGSADKWTPLNRYADVSTYLDRNLIRYLVWVGHCACLMIVTTVMCGIFIRTMENANVQTKAAGGDTSKVQSALNKMKASVICIDIVLATYIILNILACTQMYWGETNKGAAVGICVVWVYIPIVMIAFINILLHNRRTTSAQLNSMYDSVSQKKSEAHNDVEIRELKASASGVRGASLGSATDDEAQWRPTA